MKRTTVAALLGAALLVVLPRPGVGEGQGQGQGQQGYTAPRTKAGQPDLNGFWQALNTAHKALLRDLAWTRLTSERTNLRAGIGRQSSADLARAVYVAVRDMIGLVET